MARASAKQRSKTVQESPRVAEHEAQRLGLALFPVRLFLGLTFIYGGVQKLSDPGYLHKGASTYIGTQLTGFANGTPGGFVLRTFALPHPVLSGVGVALAEIAIGLLVAAGILTRPAAAAGLALNLLLFLTNSWKTYPYFLGSDIVFVFAWLPFVIAGARRQPSLEEGLQRLTIMRFATHGSTDGRLTARPDQPAPGLTRRAVLAAGISVAGAATAAIAGLSVLARGTYRSPRSLGASSPAPSTAATTAVPQSPSPAPPTAATPSGAVRLAASNQLPAGQGATYRDPTDGNPDLIIRQPNGQLVAFTALCTHAGCTVGYQGGQILCPCHGATYSAQTGAVESGPAPAGLSPRKVIERSGQIYALPS